MRKLINKMNTSKILIRMSLMPGIITLIGLIKETGILAFDLLKD